MIWQILWFTSPAWLLFISLYGGSWLLGRLKR